MRRYLELFFRHPVRFVLPIVVALVAGVAYGVTIPSSFASNATLFCDESLPNPSTIQTPVQGGQTTPAQDKQTTLEEFLATQSFVDKVGMEATHSAQIGDLAADAIVKTITVTVDGPNVLRVSAKAATAAQAVDTVQAVITEFTAQLDAVLQQRSQEVASSYKAVIASTGATLAGAQSALAAYIQAHGASTTDSQENQLTSDVALAQQQYETAQTNYNQAQLGGSTAPVDPSDFHVIDPPQVPTAPKSSKKVLLLVGVGSMMGGAVITILSLVLIMSLDRTVRDEKDLEPAFEVVATVPEFADGVLSPKGRRKRRDKQQAKVEAKKQAEQRAKEQAEQRAAKKRAEQEAKKRAKKSDEPPAEAHDEAPVEPAEKSRAATGEPRSQPPNGFRPSPVLVQSCRAALRHLDLEDHRVHNGRPGGQSVAHHGAASIGLTSCLRGEGRSTIAAGLAAAIEQSYGSKVILVELDLAHPSLAQQFGIDPRPGVAEILRDGTALADCLHMPEDGSAGVLVAGDTKGDPDGLFITLQASSLMDDLTTLCDVVIADLPPLVDSEYATDLGRQLGTVLLVVRSGTVPVAEIRHAVADLGTTPSVILNGAVSSIPPRLRALAAG